MPPRTRWVHRALTISEDKKPLKSRAGYTFFEDDPVWKIEKNLTINVGKIREHLDVETRVGFQKTIAHFATNYSSGHTKTINERFLHLIRESKSSKISVPMLISYRAILNRETEWYMGTMRAFLCKWHKLGYPGVSEDVVVLLKGWRIRGSIKGDAVKRMDPIEGPLTDNELLGFNEGTVRAYEAELIGIGVLALALLCSHTGRRPRQIAHIKLNDLDGTQKNKKGEPMYLIRIPRAKQRGKCFRNSFKDFALTQELWIILDAQQKFAIETVEQKLGMQLESSDRAILPLFPDLRVCVRRTPVDGVTVT